MAEWTTLDLSESLLAQGIKTAIGNVTGPLEAVATGAEAAAAAMSALQVLLGGSVDVLSSVRAALNALVNDLLNAGVYGLVVRPELRDNSIRAPKGINGFLRTVDASFYDQGDLNRPPYTWGDSSSGVVFLIGASSLQELSVLASALQQLFGPLWSDLVRLYTSARSVSIPDVAYMESGTVLGTVDGEDARRVFLGTMTEYELDTQAGKLLTFITGDNAGQSSLVSSYEFNSGKYTLTAGMAKNVQVGDGYILAYTTSATPPDWYRTRLLDVVPPLSQAASAIVQVRDLLPVTGATNLAAKLSTALTAKTQQLQQLSASLAGVIAAIDNLSTIPVMSVLPIPPQSGGNGGFISEAFSATNRPEIPDNYYTLGVILYGGSSTYGLLSRVFGL